MRTILLITDDGPAKPCMLTLLKDRFALASIYQVNGELGIGYLEDNANPDLIVYTPMAALDGLADRFLRIKTLARKAKVLVYAKFGSDCPYLFDYLAAGANGLLSTSWHGRAS